MRTYRLEELLGKISITLMMMYVFFWDNKIIVYSKAALYLSVILAVGVVFIRGAVFAGKNTENVKWLFIILILSIAGMFLNINSSAGTEWCLSIFLILLYSVFLNNTPELRSFTVKMIILFSAYHTFGIIMQSINPAFVNSINRVMLKSSAYATNIDLLSINYYSGFSGYNCAAGLYASVLSGAMLVKFMDSIKKKKSIHVRILYLIAAAAGFSAVIMTQKRGLMIATAIAYITVLRVLIKEKKGMLLRIILIAAGMCLIALWLLNNTESGQQILSRLDESDSFMSGREIIYKRFFEGIAERPLFGHGTGSGSDFSGGVNAHNIYLQLMYDGGIILLAAYVIFFINSLFKTVKNIVHTDNEQDRLYSIYFLYIQVVFLIYGFTGNPLYDLYMFYIYITAVAFSKPRVSPNREKDIYKKVNVDAEGVNLH